MGRGLMKIKDYFLNPCPTLLDLCIVLGIAGMGFAPQCLQGFYFCFYSAFIVVMSFRYQDVRKIDNSSLTLLCLLSLTGLFIHSFEYTPKSISFQYLNFYMMFEGFIYVFAGCLLFSVVASKAKNLRLLFLTLPFCLLKTIDSFIYSGRGSIIFAIAIALIVYLLMNKKFTWASAILTASIFFFILKHDWFLMKWRCRLPLWHDMYFNLWKHPFIGTGFNKLLVPDNMMVSASWGRTWLFKHNDYLNILNVLGVFAIIPITMFMWNVLNIVKRSWYFVPCLGIAILMFVQMTIFRGDMALAIVVFLGLAVVENKES